MSAFKMITSCFAMFYHFFNKLLCFLHIKRNRKNSGSLLPMHSKSIALSNDHQLPVPTNDVELESWDVWEPEQGYGDKMRTHNQHANKFSTKSDPEPVPDVDYFQELQLEPEIRKAQKIVVRKKDEHLPASNRLTMMSDIPLSNDLGTLEDGDCGGWSEEAVEDISGDVFKDKRRVEREKRLQEHQQKKLERDMQRNKRDRNSTLSKLS